MIGKNNGKDADKIKNKVNGFGQNKGMGFYKAIQTVMEQTPKRYKSYRR